MTRSAKLEKDIQKEICEWLEGEGYFFWRSNNVGLYNPMTKSFRNMPKFSMKGLPDVVVVYKGRFVGIECKREGFKQTVDQESFQGRLEFNGGIYILAYCVDDVKKNITLL